MLSLDTLRALPGNHGWGLVPVEIINSILSVDLNKQSNEFCIRHQAHQSSSRCTSPSLFIHVSLQFGRQQRRAAHVLRQHSSGAFLPAQSDCAVWQQNHIALFFTPIKCRLAVNAAGVMEAQTKDIRHLPKPPQNGQAAKLTWIRKTASCRSDMLAVSDSKTLHI